MSAGSKLYYNTPFTYEYSSKKPHQEQEHFMNYHNYNPHSFSPTLSASSSSTASSGSKRKIQHNTSKNQQQRPSLIVPPSFTPTSQSSLPQKTWNFTWLVFMNEKWVPFDVTNQTKLEQTLTVGGTFVDISDTHFPAVKRVRVFPRNNYLSYLGVKYRLSRIMQPDAYLDHVSVAEAKKPHCPPSPLE